MYGLIENNQADVPGIEVKYFFFQRLSQTLAPAAARPRVIMVGLEWFKTKDFGLPLGVASIVANLHCHDIAVVTLNNTINRDDFCPDAVVEDIIYCQPKPTDHIALGACIM